mmetsp:Transcript_44029/g.104787  ORF Transcript_44029/g.104787 Transcript_44029/m.104787 type:complete len:263 (+) Transcript_44029:331-1119(+)
MHHWCRPAARLELGGAPRAGRGVALLPGLQGRADTHHVGAGAGVQAAGARPQHRDQAQQRQQHGGCQRRGSRKGGRARDGDVHDVAEPRRGPRARLPLVLLHRRARGGASDAAALPAILPGLGDPVQLGDHGAPPRVRLTQLQRQQVLKGRDRGVRAHGGPALRLHGQRPRARRQAHPVGARGGVQRRPAPRAPAPLARGHRPEAGPARLAAQQLLSLMFADRFAAERASVPADGSCLVSTSARLQRHRRGSSLASTGVPRP